MKKKIIVGGGLAGLVTGFYNPDYKILDSFPGKMKNQKFPKGPHYIWDTKETRQLMEDLKVNYDVGQITIGYLIEDETVHNTSSLLGRKRYFQKSRCLPIPLAPSDLAMAESKTVINILNIKMEDLISTLVMKTATQQIGHNVSSINLLMKDLSLTDYTQISFDHIISTIPAPDFRRLCVGKLESDYFDFYWSSKIFERVSSYPSSYYDIIYDCRQDSPVSRYSNINGVYVEEYNIDRNKFHLMSNILGLREPNNYDWMFYGQIQCDCDIGHDDIHNIDYIGRLAKWKHGIKLQDIIRQARSL